MDKSTYIITAAGLGLIIGFTSGGLVGLSMRKPRSVYVKDLNGDNRPDLIIKTRRERDMFPYIQQEDGSYKSLSELQKLERDVIKAKMKELKE